MSYERNGKDRLQEVITNLLVLLREEYSSGPITDFSEDQLRTGTRDIFWRYEQLLKVIEEKGWFDKQDYDSIVSPYVRTK